MIAGLLGFGYESEKPQILGKLEWTVSLVWEVVPNHSFLFCTNLLQSCYATVMGKDSFCAVI